MQNPVEMYQTEPWRPETGHCRQKDETRLLFGRYWLLFGRYLVAIGGYLVAAGNQSRHS